MALAIVSVAEGGGAKAEHSCKHHGNERPFGDSLSSPSVVVEATHVLVVILHLVSVDVVLEGCHELVELCFLALNVSEVSWFGALLYHIFHYLHHLRGPLFYVLANLSATECEHHYGTDNEADEMGPDVHSLIMHLEDRHCGHFPGVIVDSVPSEKVFVGNQKVLRFLFGSYIGLTKHLSP